MPVVAPDVLVLTLAPSSMPCCCNIRSTAPLPPGGLVRPLCWGPAPATAAAAAAVEVDAAPSRGGAIDLCLSRPPFSALAIAGAPWPINGPDELCVGVLTSSMPCGDRGWGPTFSIPGLAGGTAHVAPAPASCTAAAGDVLTGCDTTGSSANCACIANLVDLAPAPSGAMERPDPSVGETKFC
jgi:hypothetical protein